MFTEGCLPEYFGKTKMRKKCGIHFYFRHAKAFKFFTSPFGSSKEHIALPLWNAGKRKF